MSVRTRWAVKNPPLLPGDAVKTNKRQNKSLAGRSTGFLSNRGLSIQSDPDQEGDGETRCIKTGHFPQLETPSARLFPHLLLLQSFGGNLPLQFSTMIASLFLFPHFCKTNEEVLKEEVKWRLSLDLMSALTLLFSHYNKHSKAFFFMDYSFLMS